MSRSKTPLWALLAAAACFGLTAHDAGTTYLTLGPWFASAGLITAVTAVLTVRRRAGLPVLWLLAGLVGAFSLRCLGYERVRLRDPDEWGRIQESEARTVAAALGERFRQVCRDGRSTARALARTPAFAMAVEGSDAEDYRAEAFETLESIQLPRAHPSGIPGASLYDATLRPLAWGGENVGVTTWLPRGYVPVEPVTRIIERGTETHLVLIEPLLSQLGFVSVEIPLAADRRLDNPYLFDYDAMSRWAGQSVVTRYAVSEEERVALSRAVSEYGRFQLEQGLTGAARWRIAVGCDDQTWLAASEIRGETAGASVADAQKRWAQASSTVLAVALAVALVLLLREPRHLVTRLAAVWTSRWVLAQLDVPLGLGLDLDNPAHFASSLGYGLARSPIDFLLTMGALAVSAALIAGRLGKLERERGLAVAAAGAAVALGILAGANAVLLETWFNSSIALADVSVAPLDPPRATMQVALLLLFASAGALAYTAIVLTESGDAPRRRIAGALGLDALLVILSWRTLSVWSDGSDGAIVLLATPTLFVVHTVALHRSALTARLLASEPYRRVSLCLLMLLVIVVSFYPALIRFEDRTIRTFIETTVEPSIRHYDTSRLYVIAETARAIDRMELDGVFGSRDREDLAYRLWADTELAVSAISSTVEILDTSGEVVSRFALNFPWVGPSEPMEPAPSEWIVAERRVPGAPEHPGYYLARRSLSLSESDTDPNGLGEVRVRAAFDWRNLPFVSTSNPYLHLFRSAGGEADLRFPYQELELVVLRADGTVVFQSAEGTLRLDDVRIRDARMTPRWHTGVHEDSRHNTYLFADSIYLYAVSYPQKPVLTRAAELAGWVLIVTFIALIALLVALFVGALSARDLWAGLAGSFYGKLYVAFVLIALVPLVSLAFLIRGAVVRQLERDVEQEGIARARVVGKLVANATPSDDTGAPLLTEGLLESIGATASVDVDVYRRGDLVATSKPELFASGLLRTRIHPDAYRDVVVEHLSHAIHHQALGSFEYLVASIPIALERFREPAVLSVPLASRQPEIERRVQSLNQTVLLAALGFSVGAVWLAHSLARRIAGPVNELTEATHRVAEGELNVFLATSSSDEIGLLFKSFTQMTADLKRQRDDLERTKKLEAWAEMARQVAHEIKNPLTPIQLSTEHLLRVFRDPGVDFEGVLRDCTDTILEQVKTLRQISLEFSTFASPEPLLLEPTDLVELVRDTATPYAHAPPEGITIDFECATDVPAVDVDRRLIRRTLVNLIENALHAVGHRGHVIVYLGVTDDGDAVELVVSDDGVGVDPDVRDRVFEPYFSTRAAGTGLGLAIAKKVVDDHRGTITLHSERGKGTRVRIRLPFTV